MTAANTDLLKKSKSLFSTTLSTGIGTGTGDTITPASVAGLPTDTAITLTFDRVDSGGVATPTKLERITGVISGGNFTSYVRGVDGTTEQAHTAGAVIELVWNADDLNDMVTWGLTEHNQDGTHKSALVTTLKATGAEITTGSEDAKIVTPKAIADSDIPTAKATATEVATGTDDTKYTTPLAVAPYANQSMARQAIINGNFDIAQRGTTFVAGANNDDVFTLDRWNLISDGNDILDVSQEAITDLPGSNYAIKLDVETSKRAGIAQFLEAKDAQKFKGKSVSISFAVKSANISAIRATVLSWASTADSITSDVVGTWGATPTWATNWADNATPADLTVTSSWTTVKVENIAIDESTVNNLALVIWLPNEETIGDIIYITQVEMNMGSVALPFQPKSFEEELRACMRYYEKSYSYGTAPATATTNVDIICLKTASNTIATAEKYGSVRYKVPKRTTVTPTIYPFNTPANTGRVSASNAGTDLAANSGAVVYNGSEGFTVNNNTGGTLTTDGVAVIFHYTADAEL